MLAALMVGFGWWLGRGGGRAPLAEYQPITFRTGPVGNARFTPDGSIVYSASWDGGDNQLYIGHRDDHGARELGIKDAELLSISKSGELAVRLRSVSLGGYAQAGTLARVPISGGAARELLDNVQDADWAADGEKMAVVRFLPENGHWRLEYPIGKVLFDGINWISHPKISPDGKWIAFADHQNANGDDQGSLAVIAADGSGQEKILVRVVNDAGGSLVSEGRRGMVYGREQWECRESEGGDALGQTAGDYECARGNVAGRSAERKRADGDEPARYWDSG